MGVTATEKNILQIVAGLGQATKAHIHRYAGLSPGYTEYLCAYLVRSGHLKPVDGGQRYALAPAGKKLLISLGWEADFDERAVKALAGQVAKEVAKALQSEGTLKAAAQAKAGGSLAEASKNIEIKTNYIPLIGDETATLETNIGKFKRKIEVERAASLDGSVKALKSLKKAHTEHDAK
jgi:hypothetical protein